MFGRSRMSLGNTGEHLRLPKYCELPSGTGVQRRHRAVHDVLQRPIPLPWGMLFRGRKWNVRGRHPDRCMRRLRRHMQGLLVLERRVRLSIEQCQRGGWTLRLQWGRRLSRRRRPDRMRPADADVLHTMRDWLQHRYVLLGRREMPCRQHQYGVCDRVLVYRLHGEHRRDRLHRRAGLLRVLVKRGLPHREGVQ
jgi:hypothetical protein